MARDRKPEFQDAAKRPLSKARSFKLRAVKRSHLFPEAPVVRGEYIFVPDQAHRNAPRRVRDPGEDSAGRCERHDPRQTGPLAQSA